MDAPIVIFIFFALSVALLLFTYERPNKKGEKMTGRGGDFEE